MEPSRLFFRVRAITFSLASLISFIWIILLCFEAFGRWDISPVSERNLIIVLLLTNTITVIMLPILILVKFRAWLDGARLLLLFKLHIGSAVAFTVSSSNFNCPKQTADDDGICRSINMYILLASWVVPAMLLVYCSYFALVACHHTRDPHAIEDSDEELGTERNSNLSTTRTMTVLGRPLTFPIQPSSERTLSDSRSSSWLDNNGRAPVNTNGRLSKPPPWVF